MNSTLGWFLNLLPRMPPFVIDHCLHSLEGHFFVVVQLLIPHYYYYSVSRDTWGTCKTISTTTFIGYAHWRRGYYWLTFKCMQYWFIIPYIYCCSVSLLMYLYGVSSLFFVNILIETRCLPSMVSALWREWSDERQKRRAAADDQQEYSRRYCHEQAANGERYWIEYLVDNGCVN